MTKKPRQGHPKRLLVWTQESWEDYLHWQANDLTKVQKINALIHDIRKQPFAGLGKPEPLKHDLAGYWSRHINAEHRLVYRVTLETINIVSCRYHY
ncbi:MAG: Txe/YoeB family addiction module toxin [Desulfovibrio sp.]|nr:Txe/YoeB family addiction module toxin [Desulfovibrio sp.]